MVTAWNIEGVMLYGSHQSNDNRDGTYWMMVSPLSKDVESFWSTIMRTYIIYIYTLYIFTNCVVLIVCSIFEEQRFWDYFQHKWSASSASRAWMAFFFYSYCSNAQKRIEKQTPTADQSHFHLFGTSFILQEFPRETDLRLGGSHLFSPK